MNKSTMQNLRRNARSMAFGSPYAEGLLCFLCFAVVIYALFRLHQPIQEIIAGHDSAYHYLRIDATAENLRNGTLFSGVDYLFLNGAGYASSAAYPDFFLLIPACLRLLGVGIGTTMSVYLLLCDCATYLTMFLCGRACTKSAVGGTIAAVAYTLCQYRMDNIFIRLALGEVQALIFWPLILYGLYDLIFEDFRKPYVLGIGFVGMLLSHVISTVFAFALSVLLAVLFFYRLLRQPKKLLKLLLTAVAVLAVTAFYWIPLLELKGSCDLGVDHPAFYASNYPLEFYNVFRDLYTGADGPSLGIVLFLLCMLRVFLTKRSPAYQAFSMQCASDRSASVRTAADAFALLGVFFAVFTTKLVPWKKLAKYLDFMQFPWRLFGPVSALLVLAGAIYLFYLLSFTKAKKLGLVAAVAAFFLCFLIHMDRLTITRLGVYQDDYFTSQADPTFSIGMSEYLPMAARNDGDAMRARTDVLTLDDTITCSFERNVNELHFTTPEGDAKTAEVPYIWYKGYEAVDETGAELPVTMSDHGFVSVELPGGVHEITVTHHATPLRVACNVGSLLAAVALLGLAVLHRFRKPPKPCVLVQDRSSTEAAESVQQPEKQEEQAEAPQEAQASSENQSKEEPTC